ncbi:MAG: hypothetical protein ACLQDF_14860 [Desulfomonilia bacterium]
MRRIKYVSTMVLVISISFFMSSCSGGGSGNKVSSESIDDPGASVDALGFQDSNPIELQIQTTSGDYVSAYDGQYVQPGNKRFAVTIQGDTSNIDKVFLSDGGTYQVEAIKQGDTYQADFTINSDRLYSSVLVQAINKNQLASKEKIVFKTVDDVSGDKLILNGVGVLISRDLLDGTRDLLASMLDKLVGEAFKNILTQNLSTISSLSYGDNNANFLGIEVNTFEPVHDDAYPNAIMHLTYTIPNVNLTAVNLSGQNLITTRNNNLMVDMYIALEDQESDGQRGLVLDFLGTPLVSFQNDFFMRSVIEEKIATGLQVVECSPLVADIQSLFSTLSDQLPLNIMVNNSNVDIGSLFDNQNMDLSKYLFIDLYGVPEDTSSNVLALGAGLYIAEKNSVQTSTLQNQSGESSNLNGIIIDLCQLMVNKAFDNIKSQNYGLVTNLTYGDNDSQTSDIVINSLSIQDTGNPNTKSVQAGLTIKDVDFNAISLFGFSLINTTDNDLTINATFLITFSSNSGSNMLTLDVQDVASVSFKDYFLGKLVVEALTKDTIENLENLSTSLDSILASISLAIDISNNGSQGLDFPNVPGILSSYVWDLSLPAGDSLSLVISQDNINWILSQLFTSGFQWNIYQILSPILGIDFPGFINNQSDTQQTIMSLSVPPVLDLRSSQVRMEVDGINLEYRLNGQPQWQASVDLDLIFDVKVENNELAFYISSIPENCHFHVMRDNTGKLGIFDHSNLVNDIINQLPTMLGNSPGGPVFTIGLDSFKSLIVFNSLGNPITVSAGAGYLYIDIDALDVDFSWLKGFLANI